MSATRTRVAPQLPERAATKAPTFSFVIPTLNEAADIAATLEAALAQRLPAADIVIVDGGSRDGTPDVVRRYAGRAPVVLIEEGRRRGVAAARNSGVRAATGDVVVILNADVRPGPDFLERLAPLYREGFDCVSVESRVENLDAVTGRFLQAEHELLYGEDRRQNVGWTEGFSCRRDAALRAPFPEEIPGAGGEDVVFFDRLLASGCSWKGEFSIVVPHRVPETLSGFWRQWAGRGMAVPHAERRLRGLPLWRVTARRTAAAVWSLVLASSVAAPLVAAWRRARRSSRGLRDLPAFWALWHLRMLAHRSGEWRSLLQLWRERMRGAG